MIDSLWEQAEQTPEKLSASELQILINDRLGVVTDNLSTVSRQNLDETLFDLIMLFIDSLNEKRQAILKIWDQTDFNQKLICQLQTQLTEAIDMWHQELDIHWQVGRYVQNLLFMLVITYTTTIWKTDNSPDNSTVMAKVNEIIGWIRNSKSAPLDLLEKLKGLIA
ncbi:MAG: hypothetical protein NT128_01555 [Proteobacteria bacterium]|nr:hypothetical protein [Pseudomonadota bacterium]